MDGCICFTRKIQHDGDWERSCPQGPKNVPNFLMTVQPLSWAWSWNVTDSTKLILLWLLPDIFRYDSSKKCPTILYEIHLSRHTCNGCCLSLLPLCMKIYAREYQRGSNKISQIVPARILYCGEPPWMRECLASDCEGSNFESCFWRAVSSHWSQHHLKPHSFHFTSVDLIWYVRYYQCGIYGILKFVKGQ